MRINLGGRDVGVTQHDLHTAQVGSALQQMGGKAMPKHVGREPVEDARFPAVTGQELPERLTGEAAAPRGYENVAAGASLEQNRPAGLKVCPNRPDSLLSPTHEPLLLSLSR